MIVYRRKIIKINNEKKKKYSFRLIIQINGNILCKKGCKDTQFEIYSLIHPSQDQENQE